MADNVEVIRTLGENGQITLEYAIWTYSDMYLQIKYKDTSDPNNILTKTSETKKKKVQKRWEVQSCLWNHLSKHNTKKRFLNEKMNRLAYLYTQNITKKIF